MRAIATLTTKTGPTITIINFDGSDASIQSIERAIERMKMELERAFFQSIDQCKGWQTITLTLER